MREPTIVAWVFMVMGAGVMLAGTVISAVIAWRSTAERVRGWLKRRARDDQD